MARKFEIPKLYVFFATTEDGTHTIDIYANDRDEATSKLMKQYNVKYPNFRLVKIIQGADVTEFN